jgi:hypothetical protein
MIVQNTVQSVFRCSLERAFKTPILGDATKMLTGYGVVPPCVGFSEDETWGVEGGHRIPQMAGNLFAQKGSYGFDQVLVRQENNYWKWQVDNFPPLLFFATKAQGEWFCKDNHDGSVSVKWTYSFFATNMLTYPITWLFIRIFWRGLQKKAISNMKVIAESDAPFIYK